MRWVPVPHVVLQIVLRCLRSRRALKGGQGIVGSGIRTKHVGRFLVSLDMYAPNVKGSISQWIVCPNQTLQLLQVRPVRVRHKQINLILM